jgi:hypothetical protein
MNFKSALMAAVVLAVATTSAFAQSSAPSGKGSPAPNTGTDLSNPPKDYGPMPTNETRQKNMSPASENSGIKQDK